MIISLEEIWNTPIDEMNKQLESENVDISKLLPIEKYLKFSELYDYYNKLSPEDSKIVKDPLFKLSMLRTSDIKLSTGLNIYINLISSEQQRQNFYNSRDPRCLTNNFENNNPIDPIDLTPISIENLYVINNTCYNKETVRTLISQQNIDIYRQPIPQNVFIDFNIPFFENYLQFKNVYNPINKSLKLNNQNINSNILRNLIFPNDLITLDLSDNFIDSLENVIFPNSLKYLLLAGNFIDFSFDIGNINNLNLKGLSLEQTNIRNQRIEFPNSIIKLLLGYNYIETLDNLKFGEFLIFLNLVGNPICNTNINLENIDINCTV